MGKSVDIIWGGISCSSDFIIFVNRGRVRILQLRWGCKDICPRLLLRLVLGHGSVLVVFFVFFVFVVLLESCKCGCGAVGVLPLSLEYSVSRRGSLIE